MLAHFFSYVLLAAATAEAHMIMAAPTPYGVSDLNNSPLAADGSDFPCKQRGANTYNGNGVSNNWPIGSTQTLSFKGSAVHGGGSCQVSLTTDKAPTKNSNFFVIHSIVGGCPSNTSNNGNLPANPDGTDANKYTFTIPDGVAPGEYTMAWTWFNRIGNREMYMNCAPVTVTSGSSRKRAVEERKAASRSLLKRANFPSMFVANIGNGCGTSEGADVEFPDPGSSIERDAADGKYAPPTGTCAAAVGSSGASGSGSGSSSSASSASSATAASPTQSSAQSTPPAVATTSAAAPVSTPAKSPAPVSTSSGSTPTSGSTSSSSALTGSCTLGQWNCFNNGLSFQQCTSAGWSVQQPTAAGNPCKVGTSDSAPW